MDLIWLGDFGGCGGHGCGGHGCGGGNGGGY